ncbi:MAG: UvrD-helicase domain-containing protein, partial [Clostridia bacterium]|nr:UvrD-helicase domain-containing protein [Clostridia bacterium]
MADRIWTEEQRAAIEARDHTLLVSAAAGSGKTAVLVQRILERLLDRENPCDVTDFLVVTFTRAAAGEMKEKMTRELDRELRLHPNDRRLQRQLALMPFAAFETMDGFFYRLVKEFAPELGVAGTVRIASEAELSLLFESVRDEWTELCYQNAEEDFLSAVDYFSGSRDDRSFLQVAELLRQQTMALLRREEFLEQQLQLYQNPPPFGETPFGRELLDMAALRIDAAHLALNEAVELSQNDEVLQEKYLPALLEFRESVERLEEKILQNDFSGAKALADDLLVPGFRPARGAQEDLKRQVTARRDLAKKQIEVLRERCFFLTEVQAGEDAAALSGALRGLIRYVQGLEGRFTEAKNERRILDFSDLTRLLFRLLLRREGDEFVPTERAK